MGTPYPNTLRVNYLPEEIITDHNVQPILNKQEGFVIKTAVLCPSLYNYHDEVRKYYLME